MQVPPGIKNLPPRIPARDSTEAAEPLTFTHASTTCCQLCPAVFLFPKQLGDKIFNCCYYSSLDWSRFLILEKYLSYCLLSQHERGGSCGTYCIDWFFLFSLFGSCVCYSSLLWQMLLTLDPHKTLVPQGKTTFKEKVRKGGKAPAWMFFLLKYNTQLKRPVSWKSQIHQVKGLQDADWI